MCRVEASGLFSGELLAWSTQLKGFFAELFSRGPQQQKQRVTALILSSLDNHTGSVVLTSPRRTIYLMLFCLALCAILV